MSGRVSGGGLDDHPAVSEDVVRKAHSGREAGVDVVRSPLGDTGIAGELMIEVKSGLKPGQEIVTGPFKVLRQVKEGDRVIVENEKTGSGKGPAAS